MSEQWRGMHNPERHSQFEVGGGVVCERCWTGTVAAVCYQDQPCRCCLAAEVEALRAQVQRVRWMCNTGTFAAPVLTEPEREWNRALGVILRALDGTDE